MPAAYWHGASYVISSCLQPSATITASNNFWCSTTTGNCNLDNYEPQYPPGVVATAPEITSIRHRARSGTPADGNARRIVPELHNHARDTAGRPRRPRNGRRAGPPVTFRGTYSSATAYNYGDAVAYTVGSDLRSTSRLCLVLARIRITLRRLRLRSGALRQPATHIRA